MAIQHTWYTFPEYLWVVIVVILQVKMALEAPDSGIWNCFFGRQELKHAVIILVGVMT